MNQFQMIKGSRVLTAEEAQSVDLGPLAQLAGTWQSAPFFEPNQIAQGWNVMSVPGPASTSGFVFEVIPYTETLTFQPVVVALNRGPFIPVVKYVDGQKVTDVVEMNQNITGLMYQQSIISACPNGAQCIERGFPAGSQIHAETGLLLNFSLQAEPQNPNGGFQFARLSTIPHGNSVLALGTSEVTKNPGNQFFPEVSAHPTGLNGTAPTGQGIAILDYNAQIDSPVFPGFIQSIPNSFLQKALGNQVITEMTTLSMTTSNANAGGGILNIPFIESNAKATTMDANFWIQTIQGSSQLQLQYSQVINLMFPPTGSTVPVIWPHITINTLVKVSGL